MILCRLRSRIGVYVSAFLLCLGATLALANEPITRSQAEAMIDGRLAAAGILVFGAFWVLLLTISGRSEKALAGSVARLEAAVDRFTSDLMAHNSSEYAHGPAAEHNHKPMESQMNRIEQQIKETAIKLDALIHDHDRIQETEGAVCSALDALRKRDPQDSPNPKRKTDSGEDYRPLRGRQ